MCVLKSVVLRIQCGLCVYLCECACVKMRAYLCLTVGLLSIESPLFSLLPLSYTSLSYLSLLPLSLFISFLAGGLSSGSAVDYNFNSLHCHIDELMKGGEEYGRVEGLVKTLEGGYQVRGEGGLFWSVEAEFV